MSRRRLASPRARRFRWHVAILLGLLSSGWGRLPIAQSQGLPRLRVEILPCATAPAALDEKEVRRLLVIELGTRWLEQSPWPLQEPDEPGAPRSEPGQVATMVRCVVGEQPRMELEIHDGLTGKMLRRTLELSGQARALHERLVAVSLAELLYASWAELLISPRRREAGGAGKPQATLVDAPVPKEDAPRLGRTSDGEPATRPDTRPPVEPPAQRPAAAESLGRARGVYGLLFGGSFVALQQQPLRMHGGAGLRVGGDHRHHLGWEVELQAQTTQIGWSVGRLHSGLFTGAVAVSLYVPAGPGLFRGVLGMRGGASHMRWSDTLADGIAATGERSFWGGFGGPFAAIGGGLSLSRLHVEARLELGYAPWSATAFVQSQRVLSHGGPWLGFSLGLGGLGRSPMRAQ